MQINRNPRPSYPAPTPPPMPTPLGANMQHQICDACETVQHCTNHGCIPLQPAQRKPLTDEQIEDIWADCPADWDDKINVLTLARAIEAAHGIKENT